MAGRVAEIKDQLSDSLHDATKPWTHFLALAEKRSGVDRLYIFISSIALTGLWLVFGYAPQLLCNTIGFVYPARATIHSMVLKRTEDDTKWLMYWVIFSILATLEYFSDFIIRWCGIYWLIKCIFLIWLMIPTELNGSLFIYKRCVRPYFLDSTLSESAPKDSD